MAGSCPACAGSQLRDQVGIGDLGSGHLHAVADAFADRPLGLTPIDDRSLQEHRGVGQRSLHRPTHIDVEAGRLVEVGPGLLRGVDGPAHHDEVVDARRQRGPRRSPAPCRESFPPTAPARRSRVGGRAAACAGVPRRSPGERTAACRLPHASSRWFVRPDMNWRTRLC